MAKPAEIQVDGMRELRRALKPFEPSDWKPHLKGAFGVVADIVASRASTSAHGRSNPRMGHEAAGSIKGKATTTGASVTAYKGIAWGHGHEFGSNRYRQFPAVQRGGHHLYPAIAAERDRITQEFDDALGASFDTLIGRG